MLPTLAGLLMPAKKAPNRTKKFQINLRVSQTARDILGKIADKHGMNLTHALEWTIRQHGKHEGVWDQESSKK